MSQGRYWILTIKKDEFVPTLPLHPKISYLAGQREVGGGTGYEHWQVVVYFHKKVRLSTVKELFGESAHCELTRSAAAEDYCKKSETSVEGSYFQYGKRPMKRNVVEDWDETWKAAKEGRLDDIPADVRLRCYSQIRRVEKDYMCPLAEVKEVKVFVGPTGTGKSRLAWEEAGFDAYPKDPNTKFWDGYNGQENVVIDEFRGRIDISHILRWLDRYPVCVENKGGATVLKAKKIWITSNLPVRKWYVELDNETYQALERRINVTEFYLFSFI